MDRENDIFDNPSKVQNMNFLFDDEADASAPSIDETQTFPAARRTRQVDSNGASVQRGRKVESSGTSQRQRASQGVSRSAQSGQQARSAQSRTAQPNHPAQNPSKQVRSNVGFEPKVQNVQPKDDDLFSTDEIFGNIRKAEPVNAEKARSPKNVSARSNTRTNAKTPSKTQPRQVRSDNTQKPRQARPKQAEPRQAHPRNTYDRQLHSATTRPQQNTRNQNAANAGRVNRASAQRNTGRVG